MVGSGHAPVVAVLLRASQSRSRRWRPPKDMDPRHRRLFLLQKRWFLGVPSVGATMVIMDPGSWVSA
jgi:hypothetical protein